eukprot:325345-Chlamydomonas_euryale.AAC.1
MHARAPAGPRVHAQAHVAPRVHARVHARRRMPLTSPPPPRYLSGMSSSFADTSGWRPVILSRRRGSAMPIPKRAVLNVVTSDGLGSRWPGGQGV